MGKQGPCYHCGVTSTPLWRNGPPEKPVLCNACGSRWRTKGTLENYTPLHARVEMDEFDDYTGHRVKTVSIKNKEVKLMKRRKNDEYLPNIVIPSDESLGFQKFMDDDLCNRSSSGSAISNSDSCMQFGSFDASDLTGPSQSTMWESIVPSKKRTCVSRPKQSSVEKLTRDLHTILHEQSSYLSGSSEEDLLLETDTPMVSVEIGHGSVLFRHPSAIGREEESEASSLTFENKSSSSDLRISKVKDIKHPKWEKAALEKLQILEKCDSPLLYVDLKDIFNFEEFMKNLTNDEQEELLKYLPSVDVLDYPGRLRGMFKSAQFMDNLSCFKKLLGEGVFDFTFSANVEDRKVLKRLCLTDLTKSKWMEYYTMLKKSKNLGNTKSVLPLNVDRYAERENKTVPGMKIMNEKSMLAKNIHGGEMIESEESCFHAKDLFGLPSHGSSGYASDQDLLLDLPSHSSFPEAELLSLPLDQAHINTIRR